ncbi:protein FAM200B-like [Macrobrachium nipponense]|uniref:protein FAM200B-like n=1 Tax=Macrobrachium nipponense TaxID=159736 RepID=UPI0030C8CFD8
MSESGHMRLLLAAIKTSSTFQLCPYHINRTRSGERQRKQAFPNFSVERYSQEQDRRIGSRYQRSNSQPRKSTFLGLAGGAPTMLGLQSWVCHKVKENNPSVISTRCILHREALASRTLPAEMRDVLNVAIKAVNFIKA